MNLTLQRVSQNENGTFGVLSNEFAPLCTTCEDPWNSNRVGESCIPEGVYSFVPHNGKSKKNVWRALDVPGRRDILIHAGNDTDDTEGCILVGRSFGAVGGHAFIADSQITLDLLRKILPPSFTLSVFNPKTQLSNPNKETNHG